MGKRERERAVKAVLVATEIRRVREKKSKRIEELCKRGGGCDNGKVMRRMVMMMMIRSFGGGDGEKEGKRAV